MFNLSPKTISAGCSYLVYQSGLAYFRNGRVKQLLYLPKEDKYRATVRGTIDYTVEIRTDREGRLAAYGCTCPAFDKYYGYCKHVVATLLALDGNEKIRAERELARSRQTVAEILDCFGAKSPAPFRELEVRPTLIARRSPQPGGETFTSVSLCLGEGKLYVVKNLKSFLESLNSVRPVEFGKKFTFDPRIHRFAPADEEIFSLFGEVLAVSQMSQGNYSRWEAGPFSGKEIRLPDLLLKRWLRLMAGRSFSALIDDAPYEQVTVTEADLPLSFFLEEKGDRLHLRAESIDSLVSLTGDGEYFFSGGLVYHLSPGQRQNLMPFYRGLTASPSRPLIFLEEHKERLVSELLPRIKKAGRLAVQDRLAAKIVERPLRTEIYLDTEDRLITARIKFIYGDRVINPFSGEAEPSRDEGGRIFLRDGEQEKKVMSFFEESGFRVLGSRIYLEDEEQIFHFVRDILPLLQKEGEVFFSQSFRKVGARPAPSFKGRVTINGDTDLLELDFALDGIDREELAAVVGALREKKKYYRLKDGAFLPLESEELESMALFLDGLDLKQGDLARGRLELPKFRAMYLDSLMHRNRPGGFKRDKAFKDLVQNVREPEDMDFPLPPHLEPVLREYQKTGFKWLKTLAFYGFGGILADDMGLGKTLETISFIQSEQEKNPRPALVVAPTSVIFNWQAEIEKFCPALSTLVVSGTKGERDVLIREAEKFDVVVTSYPLIRKDIADYREKEFGCCILDEAQYIKNPNSLTARTVKMIGARNCFALTGTPMENSLSELWSIFDFLMPGYLPSFEKFGQKYIGPVRKGEGKEALEELSRKIGPFILRRLKKDVVRELPEKIELKMVSELTREQKKVYLAYLEKIRGEIAAEIEKNGFDRSRMKILAGLTRLRQICCHPSLFLENYKGESGKLIQLEEVLADLKAGGHRPLLFSQFTSMLAMIRPLLDREKYRYFYLDGSVDTRERLAMAEAFNRGEGDLFLISLKAGGTGLNLTGADTVIHFDPWWNPAVEEQAADRAHRIGQEKIVHVLKFISLGTIEEKIFALQEKKKELIRQVITPGETFVSQLNEKELRDLLM